MDTKLMMETARAMVAPGKGLLAAGRDLYEGRTA